jgi:hypothetical protein
MSKQPLTPRKLKNYASRADEITIYVEYTDEGAIDGIRTVIYFHGADLSWDRFDKISDLKRLMSWAEKLGIDVVDTEAEPDPWAGIGITL